MQSSGGARAGPSIIDMRRANNIAIILARFAKCGDGVTWMDSAIIPALRATANWQHISFSRHYPSHRELLAAAAEGAAGLSVEDLHVLRHILPTYARGVVYVNTYICLCLCACVSNIGDQK